VTAIWNYAQYFAMSDNSYNTTFGPSTPGALNLVSGQTWGAISTDPVNDTYGAVSTDAHGVGTVINDPDPTFDDGSNPAYPAVSMIGHQGQANHQLGSGAHRRLLRLARRLPGEHARLLRSAPFRGASAGPGTEQQGACRASHPVRI
jgi:hypothetical protein